MEIILSDNEKRYIEYVAKAVENNEHVPLFINQKGKRYYIEFTCIDIAKANNFVLNLLNQNPASTKNIEEELGIYVHSLNFCDGDTQKGKLKEMLKEFLERLERES